VPALESDLRRQLERVVIEARDVAEAAARSALLKRAVDAAEPFLVRTLISRGPRTAARSQSGTRRITPGFGPGPPSPATG
jgi:hypothetical protein